MVHLISNQQKIECCFKEATIKDVVDYCKNKNVLGLDIETTKYIDYREAGLDPHTSKIVMLQIGDKENQFVIDTRNVDIKEMLFLFESDILFVGHNLKFEYKHIYHNYEVKLQNIHDTMIVEQVLTNGLKLKYGLADVAERYLDIRMEKETRLQFLTIGSKPFTTRQIQYGANDISIPLEIYDKQISRIKIFELENCISLEMRFLKVLGDTEYKGINFNKEKWEKTYKRNLSKFKTFSNKLNSYIIINFPNSKFVSRQLSLFEEGITCAVQWSSPKQVTEFFKFLGFCPKNDKKTSGYSVEAPDLLKVLNNKDFLYRELVETYLNYKEYEQSVTTFGLDFFKYINPVTGRIHTDFKQILNTGRISSRGPNLQQIPAREEFRHAFDASFNYDIINADYSGQESVVLCNKSQDPGMIEFYQTGEGDLHSYAATKMFRIIDKDPTLVVTKKTHPDKRQKAKAINFKLAYGGSAYTLKDDLGGITESEAQKFIDVYFEAFPGLQGYFESCKRKANKNGYVEIDPITNRRWYFYKYQDMREAFKQEDWSGYYKLKGMLERNSQNYPIQGTSGSITKLAACFFREQLIEKELSNAVFITNIVHDEINVECLKRYSKQVKKLLEKCMEKAGDVWCKTIPLKAEAVISNYWNH